MGRQMKRVAVLAAALAVLGLLCAALALYLRPMEERVYDLSVTPRSEAVPEGWVFDDKGWSAYVQEGEAASPLTPTGTGGYTGLTESGQTFYLSRTLSEALDAPALQLGPSESSVAVFLDGVLIYGDNVPQGAGIGSLRLPMLESYRADPVTISLPAGYRGKTLTIAQSTWDVEGVAPGEVMVFPLDVTLYCGYAYESGLIAQSFRTAIPAALAFAAALAVLALLVWQAWQGKGGLGLLWAAAALLGGMASILASAPFFSRYVGLEVDAVRLARLATLAALLAFLSSQAGRLRAALWALTGLFALSGAACAAVVLRMEPVTGALPGFLAGPLPELLGLISLLAALALGAALWRRDGGFYALFAPLAGAGVVAAAAWAAVSDGPGEALRQAATGLINLTPGYLLWPLMGACLAAGVLSAAVQAVQGEAARRAEARALADRERMALDRYEALSRQHQEILMLRHDMKRHLLALRGMTGEPRAAAYLDGLLGQAEAASGGVNTGNRMLDILLGSRLASARAAGVAVELERLQAPEKLPLSDGELCSLVLNILDNAIAGALAPGVERPRLRLECHVKNDFFVFNCENSSTREWMAGQAKQKPVGTHGLGRKIIGRIMARYGSLIRVETGADFYRVTLALPLLSG